MDSCHHSRCLIHLANPAPPPGLLCMINLILPFYFPVIFAGSLTRFSEPRPALNLTHPPRQNLTQAYSFVVVFGCWINLQLQVSRFLDLSSWELTTLFISENLLAWDSNRGLLAPRADASPTWPTQIPQL